MTKKFFVVYHKVSESGSETIEIDSFTKKEDLIKKIADIETAPGAFEDADDIIGVFEGKTLKFSTKVNVEVELS